MMTLYYWFRNAPEDRDYGPWWHQEFSEERELKSFLRDVGPFLHAYAVTKVDHTCHTNCQRTLSHPPNYAEIKYLTQESNLESQE